MTSSPEIFTYDLLSAVRNDTRKAKQIDTALVRVETLTRQLREGKATRDKLVEAQAELVTTCGYNFGLLIPTFFPRYPLDEPLSLLSRPFMFAMTCLAPDSTVCLRAGRQVGKCVDGDANLDTDTMGSVTIAQLFEMGQPMVSS